MVAHCATENDYYYAAVLGRITRLARPSLPYGSVTRNQKKRRKVKIGINVFQGVRGWSAGFR